MLMHSPLLARVRDTSPSPAAMLQDSAVSTMSSASLMFFSVCSIKTVSTIIFLTFHFDFWSQTLPGLRAGSGWALGGTAGWWFAVYRSMNFRYIKLLINILSIFFVIIGRSQKEIILPSGKISSVFEKSGSYFSRTVTAEVRRRQNNIQDHCGTETHI